MTARRGYGKQLSTSVLIAGPGDGPSALEFLLQSDFQTGFTTVMIATAILWWPDQAAGTTALLCRYRPSLFPALTTLYPPIP